MNERTMMMLREANSHEEELPLVPVSDVEAANSQGKSAGASWVARTGRPEFEVIGLQRFRGQWVQMRFRLDVDRDEWSWPRLSFDLGTSDFDACGIPFPRATPGSPDVELIFNVPADLALGAAASDRPSWQVRSGESHDQSDWQVTRRGSHAAHHRSCRRSRQSSLDVGKHRFPGQEDRNTLAGASSHRSALPGCAIGGR